MVNTACPTRNPTAPDAYAARNVASGSMYHEMVAFALASYA